MPYALSLHGFTLPEFSHEAPAEWVARLREISPVTDKLSHLRFRFRTPQASWLHPERGVWELYACTPRPAVEPSRAEQFRLHWSELPKERQPGRRAMVSNYQHYMWHVHGVEARRFWVLQGPWGGTPAVYTQREQRMLDAVGAISEPFPLGFFPAGEFHEGAVKLIVARDRFVQAGQSLDVLEKMDRPESLKAEDEQAEREFRKKWLDWWYEQIQPQKEFMASQMGKAQMADAALPPAPEGLSDRLATWKDQYIEHGSVSGAGVASSRKLAVAVA